MAVFDGTKKLTIKDILTDTYNGKPLIEAFNLIITTPTQTIDTTNYTAYKDIDLDNKFVTSKKYNALFLATSETGSGAGFGGSSNKITSCDSIIYESHTTSPTYKIDIEIKIKSIRDFVNNQHSMFKVL